MLDDYRVPDARSEYAFDLDLQAFARASIADLKAMQKAILWVLGSIVALFTIAGAGFAIAKAVRWI